MKERVAVKEKEEAITLKTKTEFKFKRVKAKKNTTYGMGRQEYHDIRYRNEAETKEGKKAGSIMKDSDKESEELSKEQKRWSIRYKRL